MSSVRNHQPVSALDVIERVQALGGRFRLEDNQLRVAAPAPLSPELLAEVSEHKPEIMIAFGAPIDAAVASILADIRPYLAPALQRLPDDRLLALVNWNIVSAWNTALRKAGGR